MPMRKAMAVFLLLLATGVSAQISEQITVNVVEVPVYVTKGGQTVKGLTKDDFELRINGKPQTIDYFEVVTNETTEAVPGEQLPSIDLERRRMIVLLFDLSQSSMHSLKRAQKSAEKFVAEAPRGDVFAVATLTRDGVRFALPFMRDRGAIQRAVATLKTRGEGDAFGIATNLTHRTVWTSEAIADTSALEPNNDIWGVPVEQRLAYQQSEAAILAQRVESSIGEFEAQARMTSRRSIVDHIGELALRLSSLSGIKHVVLLSEGAAFVNPSEVGSDLAIVSPLTIREAVRQLHRRYQEAGVVLDAVDTAGTAAPWCNDCKDASYDTFSTLHSMSLDTGGTVARELPHLRKAQRVTYILAFKPTPEMVDKEENSIDVKLKSAAAFTNLHYRRAWSSMKPLNGADEGLFLADVLLNDIPQNGMTVDLGATRDGQQQSVITATIPGKELLALGNVRLGLDAFIYIFDDAGNVSEWAYRRSVLDLVKGRVELSSTPYTITSRVKLAPGKYVAKVLLRTAESDATGFARTEFTVN